MATLVWKDVNIFIGGYDFTGWSNNADLALSVDALDATVFGSTTRIHTAGLKNASFTLGGLWDQDGSNAVPDERLFDTEIGSENTPILIAPDGMVADTSIGYFLEMAAESYNLGGQIGDLLPFTARFQSNSAPAQGDILVSPDAVTAASGSSTVQDLGTDFLLAGESLYVGWWVLSVDATTLDMNIRSDTVVGMSSPTTRGSFVQATGPRAEIIKLDGLIGERYWDVDWTLTGGNTDATFAVAFGVVTE